METVGVGDTNKWKQKYGGLDRGGYDTTFHSLLLFHYLLPARGAYMDVFILFMWPPYPYPIIPWHAIPFFPLPEKFLVCSA